MKKTMMLKWTIALAGGVLLGFFACNSPMDGNTYAVSDVPMIDDYLLVKDASLSDFGAVVEYVGYQGTLHAYGTYTCFAPDNEAMAAWVAKKGVSSWKEISEEELKNMVKFHLINDTLATNTFVDGRMVSPNSMRKYLTTRVLLDENRQTYIEVNRQAKIVERDILCDNGYVHKIDQVLEPAAKNVYLTLKEDYPEKYGIFLEAIEKSSYKDILSQSNDSIWYTLLVESDSVLNSNGIYSYNDLIDSMAVIRVDIVQEQNLCNMYVGYHIIPSLCYLTDLKLAGGSKTTCIKNNVITITIKSLDVLLNLFTADALNYDPGVKIDVNSYYSDFSCENGVIHVLEGFMPPRIRKASPVYWDIAEQPELLALKEFRQNGTSVTFLQGELSEINFEANSSKKGIVYTCDQQFGDKFQYVYYDYLTLGVNPSELLWLEMKTPLLIEGEYNVWVCWRRSDFNTTFRSYFIEENENGERSTQQFPNVFDMYQYLPTGKSTSQLLNEGLKYYVAKRPRDPQGKVFPSKLLGTITVHTTGRHYLRFEGLSGSGTHNWDMIHFIPKNQTQLWPRFDVGGNQIWENTPCDSILPYVYEEGCSK